MHWAGVGAMGIQRLLSHNLQAHAMSAIRVRVFVQGVLHGDTDVPNGGGTPCLGVLCMDVGGVCDVGCV